MTRATSPTLLLIAQHPQFIYLIKRYSERSGCRAEIAYSISNAVEQMRLERPAMALLHVSGWSPEGLRILRDLKQHCGTRDIPFAIISTVADEARARAEGATCWLWQPVMYGDFVAALAAAGVLPPATAPGAVPDRPLS